MPEEKVYSPEIIQENPFPGETSEVIGKSSSKPSAGKVYSPAVTSENTVRRKRVAVELLSRALNTNSKKVLQEFQLQESGGFKIGNYKKGKTGEVSMTPNGMTAKDTAGVLTFVLNALTGSATFKGTVQAGSIVSGLITVGNSTWVIDGDSDYPRILLYNGGIPEILIGEPD